MGGWVNLICGWVELSLGFIAPCITYWSTADFKCSEGWTGLFSAAWDLNTSKPSEPQAISVLQSPNVLGLLWSPLLSSSTPGFLPWMISLHLASLPIYFGWMFSWRRPDTHWWDLSALLTCLQPPPYSWERIRRCDGAQWDTDLSCPSPHPLKVIKVRSDSFSCCVWWV